MQKLSLNSPAMLLTLRLTKRLAHGLCALALTAACLPALASSTAGSSAVDSASSATSSASDSLKTSSQGSSKATGVAQGNYTITAALALADRPEQIQLTLTPAQDSVSGNPPASEFQLVLPLRIYQQAALDVGQIVSARTRNYGVEFAKASTAQSFFLVLDDAVYRELNPIAVTL